MFSCVQCVPAGVANLWGVKIDVIVLLLQSAVHFMRMDCVLKCALLTEQPVQPLTLFVVSNVPIRSMEYIVYLHACIRRHLHDNVFMQK